MDTPKSKARILVVDDEQHQLDTICRGLFLYDYESEGVSSAQEALEVLRRADHPGFHLMLTDLTMPDQSGLSLVREVREFLPDLPIIVITGLAATDEVERIKEMHIPILPKPFRPDLLVESIESLLD